MWVCNLRRSVHLAAVQGQLTGLGWLLLQHLCYGGNEGKEETLKRKKSRHEERRKTTKSKNDTGLNIAINLEAEERERAERSRGFPLD